jgi:2-dehydropantoate 2-reductase
MRILVVGAGSVGGYFGGLLGREGHDVGLIARGAHARAIRDRGLSIETPTGELRLTARVIEPLAEARGFDAEVVIVAVKARDLGGVLGDIPPALAPGGVAVSLLNGLDSEQALAGVLDPERVFGGKVMIAAGRIAPGRLYVRAGGEMLLAPLVPASLGRARELASVFSRAFPCTVHPDLRWVLYRKLLWNAPFSALSAITGRPAGEVLEVPALEGVARAAMAEVLSVARAEGVDLGPDDAEAMIRATREVFGATTPSMQQDLGAGQPTEADAIQGALVERGARHGIPTPVNQVLWALIQGLEVASARARG